MSEKQTSSERMLRCLEEYGGFWQQHKAMEAAWKAQDAYYEPIIKQLEEERDRFYRTLTKRADLEKEMIEEIEAEFKAELTQARARIKELEAALKPFAKFACDEPHVNEPECHNCKAKSALNRE